MVNELAPRAHNSGHHTIEQCATSQFGQLLRVVLDLPLGDVSPTRAKAAAMVNILGSPSVAKGSKPLYRGLREALGKPGVYPHLYGKSTVSPFRKMGHITMVGDDPAAVVELGATWRARVGGVRGGAPLFWCLTCPCPGAPHVEPVPWCGFANSSARPECRPATRRESRSQPGSGALRPAEAGLPSPGEAHHGTYDGPAGLGVSISAALRGGYPRGYVVQILARRIMGHEESLRPFVS